ncbi:hypothetical protein B484DRAFT_466896 [Ochromonadaceae sp. CCMP2298]|nr:hypothetical protein B484DRAFT_466896 [Ochromonadaceae sp. CCMP2298]
MLRKGPQSITVLYNNPSQSVLMSAASSKRSAEESASAGSASKRAKSDEFNSTQIIDGDIESDSEWAVNLAEKIAAGNIVKVPLSRRLQSCLSKIMGIKEETLEKAAAESTLVEMDEKEYATVTDRDCLDGMTKLSKGLLHVLSVILFGGEDAPEPLTNLLAPVDDQSNLSLFRYKGGSAAKHEDRELLTIVYAPGSNSLVDQYDQCVSLADDEVAVWSGCALQAATAVPSYEKAVIQAALHSIKPLQTTRYSLVFRLRGCGVALLDPTRFLSPAVLVRQLSQGSSAISAFYRRLEETHKSVNQPAEVGSIGSGSASITIAFNTSEVASLSEQNEEEL